MDRHAQQTQAFTVKMGGREIRRGRDGRQCFRVPAYIVQLVGFNGCGWFGWDPINLRWVSAPYGLPFAYAESLRGALAFIDWGRKVSERCTIDFVRAYPSGSSLGALSMEMRQQLAEILFHCDSGSYGAALVRLSDFLSR